MTLEFKSLGSQDPIYISTLYPYHHLMSFTPRLFNNPSAGAHLTMNSCVFYANKQALSKCFVYILQFYTRYAWQLYHCNVFPIPCRVKNYAKVMNGFVFLSRNFLIKHSYQTLKLIFYVMIIT